MTLVQLRTASAAVAERAVHVRIDPQRLAGYADELSAEHQRTPPAPRTVPEDPETAAAFWITLDAVNFGSGWFPTLRKAGGATGYRTIAAGVRRRFDAVGPWPAGELGQIEAAEIAGWVSQDADHPLMGWFATSLRDLGVRLEREFGGRFLALARSTGGSAVALAERLGSWPCFADTAEYGELRLPFLKRAQIVAADLHRTGVIDAPDLSGLTMFADNLVPHVLRLDGVLRFTPELVARIEQEELIEPGSDEEVEIRAAAVQAVEQLAARSGITAAELDERLWHRGQGAGYKAVPRHRCRTTAY